jgi:oxygen-independent coproporphyrinogen III oxidase
MQLCLEKVKFNADLIEKYNQPIPRYTSYPPATELTTDFTEEQFLKAIKEGNEKQTPLSLYCHIPFCQSACYFCGCNVIVTQAKDKVVPTYLEYLFKNIEQIAPLVDKNRQVVQLHWGGGTPNYLDLPHVEALFNKIKENFTFAKDAEISIEINPRYVDRNYILSLRNIGFNRVSFGIQDFNTKVQETINRVQPEEMLFNVMSWMREADFESVNVDLIYGLPYQTAATFKETIAKTIQLNPDRIAVFNFAYIPWVKPVQKNLPENELPNSHEKLELLHIAIDQLQGAGYYFIGMDHFAKPNDELAIAQSQGKLHRNFQGYTTKPESELVAFGLTAISMLDNVYVQNHKTLKDFYKSIDEGKIPMERGVKLAKSDNILRREIIMELMCHYKLDKKTIENKYNINFDEYFAEEEHRLEALAKDGLINLLPDKLEVTSTGRLLIRNIAFAFDNYSQNKGEKTFSKAI